MGVVEHQGHFAPAVHLAPHAQLLQGLEAEEVLGLGCVVHRHQAQAAGLAGHGGDQPAAFQRVLGAGLVGDGIAQGGGQGEHRAVLSSGAGRGHVAHPGEHAALQVAHVAVAGGEHGLDHLAGAAAALAADHVGLLAVGQRPLAEAGQGAGLGQQVGAFDTDDVPLVGLAHVDQPERLPAAEQGVQLLRADHRHGVAGAAGWPRPHSCG